MTKNVIIGFAVTLFAIGLAACGQTGDSDSSDGAEAYSTLEGSEDLPDTLPGIVPLFQPATVRSAIALGSDAWIIKLVTDASKDEVKVFYETAFSENGFELTDDFSDGFSDADGIHRAEDIEIHTVVNDGTLIAGIDDDKAVIDLAVSLVIDD